MQIQHMVLIIKLNQKFKQVSFAYLTKLKTIFLYNILDDSNSMDGINNKVYELTQKLTWNSSKLDQQLNRLNAKIDRLASNVNIVSC